MSRHRLAGVLTSTLVILLCFAGAALADNRLAWSPPQAVTTPDLPTFRGVALVSPEPDVAYVLFEGVVVPGGNSRAHFTRTLDAGRTWSAPLPLETIALDAWEPHLRADLSGHVYAAWSRGDHTIQVNRSEDKGQTWRVDPMAVDGGLPSEYTLQLASDESGAVFVMGRAQHLWLNISHDYASTWRNTPLAVETIGGVKSTFSLSRIGINLYATFTDRDCPPDGEYTPEGDGTYFVLSHDDGETWLPAFRLDDRGNPRPEICLVAADLMGHVYVLWSDQTDGFSDLYVKRSEDFGDTWPFPSVRVNRNVLGAGWAVDPTMVVDCTGRLYVSYVSSKEFAQAVYINRSDDFGASFLENDVQVSRGPGTAAPRQPSMDVLENGHVVVAWQDSRRSYYRPDIYASTSFDHGDTWLIKDVRMDTGLDLAESAEPVVALNQAGQAYVEWTDQPDDFDFSGPYVSIGLPRVEIGDAQEVLILPAEGGSFTARLRMRNDQSVLLQDLPVWVDVTLPNGRSTPPVLGPKTLYRLGPGRTLEHGSRLRIPARVDPGPYVVNLQVGGGIDDSGSFCVFKMP